MKTDNLIHLAMMILCCITLHYTLNTEWGSKTFAPPKPIQLPIRVSDIYN